MGNHVFYVFNDSINYAVNFAVRNAAGYAINYTGSYTIIVNDINNFTLN